MSRLRCPKCGGTDIYTRWHANGYSYSRGCGYSDHRDRGTDGEHLHRYCRRCGYGWGDPVLEPSRG